MRRTRLLSALLLLSILPLAAEPPNDTQPPGSIRNVAAVSLAAPSPELTSARAFELLNIGVASVLPATLEAQAPTGTIDPASADTSAAAISNAPGESGSDLSPFIVIAVVLASLALGYFIFFRDSGDDKDHSSGSNSGSSGSGSGSGYGGSGNSRPGRPATT